MYFVHRTCATKFTFIVIRYTFPELVLVTKVYKDGDDDMMAMLIWLSHVVIQWYNRIYYSNVMIILWYVLNHYSNANDDL